LDDGVAAALLLLDFVDFIVERFSSDPGVTERAAVLLASAREAGLPAFHVVPASFESGIHPLLQPRHGEPVLSKTTIGAFGTTDLRERLDANGVDELLIAGVATGGTVLSTTRWAYDVGYKVTVCVDACSDPEPGAHAALVDPTIFPRAT
jgi:Isochorismatase family